MDDVEIFVASSDLGAIAEAMTGVDHAWTLDPATLDGFASVVDLYATSQTDLQLIIEDVLDRLRRRLGPDIRVAVG